MAASVTGAGLALPLLTAGGAQAADTATWDRVAMCESGGMWSANAGNGFYGGLQLTLQMWRDYGGESYAERPDLASRSQQIAVAESILNDRGPDAWPSCAVNARLDVDGLIPDVDPGGSETPDPQPSESGDEASAGTGDEDGADTAQPSGDASAEPSGDATSPSADEPDAEPSGDATSKPSDGATGKGAGDAGDADKGSGAGSGEDSAGQRAGDSADRPSGDASTPSGDASAPSGGPSAPGTGRHRGSAGDGADEKADGKGKDGRSVGRHASRGGDAHRGTSGGDDTYTVRPGDSLSAIVEERGLAGGWTGLYDANEGVIGTDPDLIHPGQRLVLGQ
ncbi:transglycosylase family protein [Streptomyces sp. NPDC042319]|uniref:transglycosylase family protein n=1 Tax=Streptomyces sp. NPDC042319 TaxID=3154332 RepID=UPI0033D6A000